MLFLLSRALLKIIVSVNPCSCAVAASLFNVAAICLADQLAQPLEACNVFGDVPRRRALKATCFKRALALSVSTQGCFESCQNALFPKESAS